MKIALTTIIVLLTLGLTNTYGQGVEAPPVNSGVVSVSPEFQNANVDIDFAVIDFNITTVNPANSILEAGLAVAGAGNTMWINYTFRQNGNSPSTASIDINIQGLPPTVTLTLVPIETAGTASGIMLTGNQVLTNGIFPNFITSIPAGFSGDGLGSGFHVSYLIDNPNNEDLSAVDVGYVIKYQ